MAVSSMSEACESREDPEPFSGNKSGCNTTERSKTLDEIVLNRSCLTSVFSFVGLDEVLWGSLVSAAYELARFLQQPTCMATPGTLLPGVDHHPLCRYLLRDTGLLVSGLEVHL